MLPGEFPDFGCGVLDPGARLVVDHRDDFGPGLEFALEPLKVERGSPIGLEDGDAASVALSDLCETVAELTVHERDDRSVPREVRDAGFHSGSSGAADDVEFVFGAKKGL